jgi:hypothetical protein
VDHIRAAIFFCSGEFSETSLRIPATRRFISQDGSVNKYSCENFGTFARGTLDVHTSRIIDGIVMATLLICGVEAKPLVCIVSLWLGVWGCMQYRPRGAVYLCMAVGMYCFQRSTMR